jgi:serine/threonine-protein kinase
MGEHGALVPGTILARSYELVRELAHGGMGTVWEARHLRLSSPIAVKVLRGIGDASSETFRRFRREAEIASQLGHPHIVKVLDFDALPDGSPFLVMELLRGESLRDRIGRGPLGLELALDLTRQIGSALHAAHRAGIVHRDLKPENIFLSQVAGQDRPHAVLLDFGISKLASAGTALTQEGTIFGTPQYMAPEQADQAETDARTDQYALAAVYEMLCGAPAFEPGPSLKVLYRVVNTCPPRLDARAPGIAPAIAVVVESAMAKAPAQRFPDVLHFVHELERATGASAPTIAVGGARSFEPTLPPADGAPLPPDANAPTLPPEGAADPAAPTLASSGTGPPAPVVAATTVPVVLTSRWLWVGVGGIVVALVVVIWALTRPQVAPPFRPPGPPMHAVKACKQRSVGTPCSFQNEEGALVRGQCWSPNPAFPPACRPNPR